MKNYLSIMIVGFSLSLSSSISYALDCNGKVGFEGPINLIGSENNIQKTIGDYELHAAILTDGKLLLEIKDSKNKSFKTGALTQIPEEGKEVSTYIMTERTNILINCKN
jgi:hypothetical protein